MTQKTKKMLKWIPSLIVSLQIGISAIMKLTGNAFMVQNFTKIGLQNYMYVFACMELFFVFLFIWKRSMKIGFLMLTAYFGGAMAIEMIYGNPFVPAMILTIVWLAAYLREPVIFKLTTKIPVLNTAHC